ncbi:MAG: 16S rRNA (uracil(1498)-N(3))-methyltransferase [Bacteroidales bacterium]|nr:16S rRNA (uracil(1498)-N(3))-methyltransferase [Bacteroidales bacterium]
MDVFFSTDIEDGLLRLSGDESRHCIKVLRHRKGDKVRVSGGDGNLYLCSIVKDDPKGVELLIEETLGQAGAHPYYLRMAVAPTKNIDRFEWFVEKATEVGIDHITPLQCEHSQRRVINLEREQRLMVAAAKQSMKGVLPLMDDMTDVKSLMEQCKAWEQSNGRTLTKLIAFCDSELTGPDGTLRKRVHIKDAVKAASGGTDEPAFVVLIGPEGDFSAVEISAAAEAGFIPVSLGEQRLRTETAALYATITVSLLAL